MGGTDLYASGAGYATSVTAADGKRVPAESVGTDRTVYRVESGVYIVNAGTKSVKVMVR